MKTEKMNRNKLNEVIRNKIAVQLVLNKSNTHKEIADFYGISRQLVTLIAKENGLQRSGVKGTEGPDTFPKRKKADFEKINAKFSDIDVKRIKEIVDERF